jgi:hypothetical protein
MSGVRAPGEAEEKTAGLTGEVPAASRKQPRRQAAGCQALPDYISLAERDDRGPRRSGGGLERPAAKARYFEATRGVKRGRVVERQRGDSDDEEPWRPKPKLAREAPCAASVAKAKVAEGAGTTAAKPAGGPESASSDSSDSSDAGDEAPDEGPGDRSIPALYRGERNASRRAQLVRAQVREHAGEDVRMDIPAQETLDFIHLDFSVRARPAAAPPPTAAEAPALT